MIAAETVLIGFRGMSRAAAIRAAFPDGVPDGLRIVTVEGGLPDEGANDEQRVTVHRCEPINDA